MRISVVYKNLEDKETVNLFSEKIKAFGHILDEENPELVLFVGGDGTFLRAVQKYLDKLDDVTFIGVHDGKLGYFYDYHFDEIDEILKDITFSNVKCVEIPLIRTDIYGDKDQVIYSLNEVRLENPFHTLVSEVYINEDKLETFRGNGLLVCSPFGSSAYNRSLSGAVIDPNLHCLELTEIASIQNNAYRSLGSSLVVSGDSQITFKGDYHNIVIGYDHLTLTIEHVTKMVVSVSDKKVSLGLKKSHSYIHTLNRSFVK